MSAFIVDDKTINGLVSFLNRDRGYCGTAFERLGYALKDSESLDKLASDLFQMNCDAVDERYGKGTSAGDTAEYPAFAFRFVRDVSAVAAYKGATCLHYQCSEGDVPERPLYEALEDVIHAIAQNIIARLPEYDAAKWG